MRRNLVFLVAVAVIVAFGLVGCGGGDGDGDGNGVVVDANLFGVWQPYLTNADGDQIAPADAFGWDDDTVRMTIQFANDGTVTVREYDDDGVATAENGTWTAAGGNGTITIDAEVSDFTYASDGQVLALGFAEDGSEMTARCVPVIDVSGNAAELTRAWQVTQIEVNGSGEAVADFFGFPAGADRAVLQMLADGVLRVFFVDAEGEILEAVTGTWATNGELVLIRPENTPALRGVWAANNTSLTFLDEDGSTTKFELAPWAPAGTRDASAVGHWEAESVTVNGQAVNMADFFEWAPGADRMWLNLWSDGTAAVREVADPDDVLYGALGVWDTDGNELTLDVDVTMEMDYTLSDDTLTVSFTADGEDVTIVWTRVS
ncbi:MAG: lipocalin family protein [Armatimonadota bacterium]